MAKSVNASATATGIISGSGGGTFLVGLAEFVPDAWKPFCRYVAPFVSTVLAAFVAWMVRELSEVIQEKRIGRDLADTIAKAEAVINDPNSTTADRDKARRIIAQARHVIAERALKRLIRDVEVEPSGE